MYLFNCGTKELLPSVTEDEQADTSYIQITPNWEEDIYHFKSPRDILVGDDGYIFVADSGNRRILVLDQAGNIIREDEYGNDFSPLENLEISSVGNIQPLRLTQDSKMNLLIADGGNRVFAWNQYFNNVDIDSIATDCRLHNSNTNQYYTLYNIDSLSLYLESGWEVAGINFGKDEATIAEILAPHVFFDGTYIINILHDEYGDPRNSKIIDIAAFGQDYNNGLYLMDRRYNRVVRARYYIKHLLLLSNGTISIDYGCWFYDVVTGQGYGTGYVMEPTSLSLDVNGNIFYTQTGGNFYCHAISSGTYRALFEPGSDDILNTNRYGLLSDIGVDPRGTIYVVDAELNCIHTFDGKGTFMTNIGTSVFDGDEVGYIFDCPQSITIKDDIIYIADTGNNRIVRFQYVILAEQSITDSNIR